MKINQTLQLLLACGILSAGANASTVFNFDSDNLGTATGFTDTVDGLSATFTRLGGSGRIRGLSKHVRDSHR